jgi:hypothetical protein
MPDHIARSRTIPSRDRVQRPLGAQPHAGRREPAAADPVSGDPVWLGCFKGKNVFLITENAFSLGKIIVNPFYLQKLRNLFQKTSKISNYGLG